MLNTVKFQFSFNMINFYVQSPIDTRTNHPEWDGKMKRLRELKRAREEVNWWHRLCGIEWDDNNDTTTTRKLLSSMMCMQAKCFTREYCKASLISKVNGIYSVSTHHIELWRSENNEIEYWRCFCCCRMHLNYELSVCLSQCFEHH